MTRTLRVHVTQSALDTDTERRMVTARPPVIIIIAEKKRKRFLIIGENV